MMRSLTTAATGMMAQQLNLDTISNNLANVNTTGFKSQRAEFQDMMYQTFQSSGAPSGSSTATPMALQVGLGSRFSANGSNMTTGPMNNTGNALDIAIRGDGFFKISRPDGSSAYTRDGSFKVDAEGALVTSDGYHLVPDITIPTGATSITVAPNGALSAIKPGENEPSQLGIIQIATFPNPGGLTRIGQNLYTAGGASGSEAFDSPGKNGAGTLQAGFLEGSNVQVVDEMVRMITAQRSYEINSKAIQTADEMLSTINGLKR